MISLQAVGSQKVDEFATALVKIAGVEDVILHDLEGVAYLKVDNQQLDRPALQQLINQYTEA